MNNPEVQQIMGDPAMRMILEQMQTDPQVLPLKNHFWPQRGQGRKIHPIVFPVQRVTWLLLTRVSTIVAQLKILGIYWKLEEGYIEIPESAPWRAVLDHETGSSKIESELEFIQNPHCLNNLNCTLIHIELQAVQEHLKNPAIMEKIMKLKDAGLISMSYR